PPLPRVARRASRSPTRCGLAGAPTLTVGGGRRARAPRQRSANSALCNRERLCYSRPARIAVVPGSSAVEQPAVNRLVDGSNPSRGATFQLLNSRSYAHGVGAGRHQFVFLRPLEPRLSSSSSSVISLFLCSSGIDGTSCTSTCPPGLMPSFL